MRTTTRKCPANIAGTLAGQSQHSTSTNK